MLHTLDLVMLDTIDCFPHVRKALLAAAAEDPETAQAAQHARAAAERMHAEDDSTRAQMIAAQEQVWFHRATRRPHAHTEEDSSTGGVEAGAEPNSIDTHSVQTIPGTRQHPRLKRAAAASQPCLVGCDRLACLPPLQFASSASRPHFPPASERLAPVKLLARARIAQRLQQHQQEEQQAQPQAAEQRVSSQQQKAQAAQSLRAAIPDAVPAASRRVPHGATTSALGARPVTAAAARRLHARAAMYLPLR